MEKIKEKIKPPLSDIMPEFKFPPFKFIKLSDNINIYSIEDNTKPLINIKIMFHRGAYLEKIAGLSYFCARLLTQGTINRTAQQIAEAVDSIGAGLNSSCSWDATSINITSLSDFTEIALDIILDSLLNSVFSNDEIHRFKIKHISEIEQKLASPDYLASLAFSKALYTGTNFSNPILGSRESIISILRDDCLNWYNELLHHSKISVIITGNVNADFVADCFQKKHDKIKKIKPIIKENNKLKIAKKNSIVAVDKEDSLQAVLRIGKFTVGREHKHYPAVQVINTIFGGSFLSRLNKILREELGYTYGISSYIDSRKASSSIIIGTSINLEATSKSIKEILKQMYKISTLKVTLSELETAKKYIAGSFVRSTETIQQLGSLLSSIALHSLKDNYFEKYLHSISDLNKEVLLESQTLYFNPENLAIAAVGNIEKLKNILHEFGNIEVLKF